MTSHAAVDVSQEGEWFRTTRNLPLGDDPISFVGGITWLTKNPPDLARAGWKPDH